MTKNQIFVSLNTRYQNHIECFVLILRPPLRFRFLDTKIKNNNQDYDNKQNVSRRQNILNGIERKEIFRNHALVMLCHFI